MKFRRHTGGLKESMETVMVFYDLAPLVKYLEGWWDAKINAIHFKNVGDDDRIGWCPTYMVTIDIDGVTPNLPVGWSDGVLDE
jgi:hypothetical protein